MFNVVLGKEVSSPLTVNIVTSQKELFFFCRIDNTSSLSAKNQGKKRKIAETSNVITETLPSVEGEQVSMITKKNSE